jgi:hypothetical protein
MVISEQIIEVFDYLFEKFGIAVDWSSENVIPTIKMLCEKLTTYEICTSIVYAVFWIAFCIALTVVKNKMFKKLTDKGFFNGHDGEFNYLMTSVLTYILLGSIYIVTIIVLWNQTADVIQCAVFPEMYIFEYIKPMINV